MGSGTLKIPPNNTSQSASSDSTPTSSTPSIARSWRRELSGSTQRLKPSFAPPRARASSACAIARTSPASPTSPINSVRGSTGRSRKLEATAARRPRSAAGSSMRDAAGDVQEDVLPGELQSDLLLEDRDQQRRAVGSMPSVVRRGVPKRGRRDERLDLDEHRAACPRAPRPRPSPARRRAARRGRAPTDWPPRASPLVLHLEHADLVGRAEAILDARAARGTCDRGRPRSRGRCRPCARARAGRRARLPS